MSEVAHQYQEEFNVLKQQYLDYVSKMPTTETEHGPMGDWAEGSVEDLTELLGINEEQIRVVERILEERKGQMVGNPDGHDPGHSKAIAQWTKTLAGLKANRHLMFETRNFKLVLRAKAAHRG